MIGMTFDTPPDLQTGDVVETITEIRRYDIVCWERVGKHNLMMRSLSPLELLLTGGESSRLIKVMKRAL